MASRFSTLLQASSSTLPRRCMTTCGIWLIADGIAQHQVEAKSLNQHDWTRSARQAGYGGVILAPMMSFWLGNVIQKVVLKGKLTTLATRVALDQTVMGPSSLSLFFTYSTLASGGSTQDVKEKFKRDWWNTYKAGFLLWTPAQAINFALIPPSLRLLFLNCTSLLWSTFLSFTSSKSVPRLEVTQVEMEPKESAR